MAAKVRGKISYSQNPIRIRFISPRGERWAELPPQSCRSLLCQVQCTPIAQVRIVVLYKKVVGAGQDMVGVNLQGIMKVSQCIIQTGKAVGVSTTQVIAGIAVAG